MSIVCERDDCDSERATTRLMPNGREVNLCEECLDAIAEKLHREIEQWYQREVEKQEKRGVVGDD